MFRLICKLCKVIRIVHIAVAITLATAVVTNLHESSIMTEGLRMGVEILGLTLILLLPVTAMMKGCMEEEISVSLMAEGLKKLYIPVLTLCFMVFVYLPSESFVGNRKDFVFTYQMFIPCQVLLMVLCSLAVSVLLCTLKKRLQEWAGAVLFGLDLAVYVQYMFLNGGLTLLDGEVMDWSRYHAEILMSYLVWGVLLVVPVLLMCFAKRIWERIRGFVPACLGGMQLLALCIMLLSAPASVYEMNLAYMTAEEQYTVSAKDNIVLFILDAADNEYIKEWLEKDKAVFDELKDFTIYTNTCSVFDSTPTSITQMLTGMDFAVELTGEEWYRTAWNSERAVEFYDRLHAAGYRVNGYSIEDVLVDGYAGKYDNYRQGGGDAGRNMEVEAVILCYDFGKLSMYRALPMGLKRFAHIEDLDFSDAVRMLDVADYENDDYLQNLELVLSDTDRNYLIVEHLEGTHSTRKGMENEMKYLLEIMGEYMGQMQKLGVYEDATIIITADHGAHNDNSPQKAGTPIFMVKRKGESREEIILNNAPVYHEDIQATLLDCAGLYDRIQDEEMFGRSVFDIKEEELRERSWYDRQYDDRYPEVPVWGVGQGFWTGCNVYYGYTYTGDTETLRQMVGEGSRTVYPMVEYKG